MRLGGLFFITIVITFLVIWKRKWLLWCIVFFAPFCASSVLSFNSFFLQPGHYFLFLYIAISVILVLTGKIKIIKIKPNWLIAFTIWAFLTIIISLIFHIDVPVYGIGNNVKLKSSLVSFQNFTQFLYLVLGLTTFLILRNYCIQSENNWEKTVSIFGISGIVVLLIGFYQIIAHRNNLLFDEIFRNNVKVMWQTKERVQSTMGEASFLGQFCVYLIGIYFSYKWTDKKFLRIIGCFFVVIIGILTRSTGFLFGTIVVFLAFVFFSRLSQKNAKIYSFALITLIIAIPIAYEYFEGVQKLIDFAIAKIKLDNWSGIERSSVFKYMLQIGFRYPFSGIGFGGGRSTDLYANILANTGIIGFFLFFSFVITDLYKLINKRFGKGALMCILLIIGFLVTSASVPDISFLPLWVIFAIIDSRIYINNISK